MSEAVTLFGLRRSVYTRIANITLLEKGVDFRFEDVEIFGPDGVPVEHLLRHPFGRIPVLQHGTLMLFETAAICRYIDEAFEGPRLQPDTPVMRARMTQAIALLDSYAYRPMVWDIFEERISKPLGGASPDESTIAAAVPKTRTSLTVLSDLLANGEFFGRAHPCLADFHAYPMLAMLGLTPEGQAMFAEHPSLRAWFGRMEARSSIVETVTGYELSVPSGNASEATSAR